MPWFDIFKLFTYAFTNDPLSKKADPKNLTGAGITSPDSILDLRNLEALSAGGSYIRVQNELIDTTMTTNRINRYKEYDRLVLSVPEIEMAMTVFADEACVAGTTRIQTVYDGQKTIEWLANNKTTDPFPVYSYDFENEDYTIGWAYAPRYVKTDKTIMLVLDDGTTEIVTPDHKILRRDGTWAFAGDLKFGDQLMPFYKVKACSENACNRIGQFPRILSFKRGWIHERQFIDEWRLGKSLPQYEIINKISRLTMEGMRSKQIIKLMKRDWTQIQGYLKRGGFSFREMKLLSKKQSYRRVVGVIPHKEMAVYDLSVEQYKNFCTSSIVMHNCQKDEEGRCFKISCKNKDVVDECVELFFDPDLLNFNQRNVWDKVKRLFIKGDEFWEIVIDPDNPKNGIIKINDLPPETMFRIETIRGKVIEYQQSKEMPDYTAITKAPIQTATEAELQQSTAIRFAPEQIIHLKIGDYRRTFYPYGVSLIEPARGPAHQLRMMEDAMVIYRLTRAPERRVFYVDVGQLPPYKAEAFMDRIKDQFRKKKVPRVQFAQGGASAVEEKWHAPAQDEDYWLPIRPNSNTRIETLPGAQNLGEIDDTVYFRNKLFTALNFPKNYFSLEDPNATRITLSAQDVKFARMIERLQSHFEEALCQLAYRHLKLRGFPEESYKDLTIKMTPPSDWRELSRAEIITNRINNASSLMSAQIYSLYDVLTKILKHTEDEAKEMISRMKIQKLEDIKLQILAQNPQLLGVGMPQQGEQEIGSQPGGPSPMLSPEAGHREALPSSGQPSPIYDMKPPVEQAKPLPTPSDDEIAKYDLEIQDYEREMDTESPDHTETEEAEY